MDTLFLLTQEYFSILNNSSSDYSVQTNKLFSFIASHCIRRALARSYSEEMKILNTKFSQVGIEPTTCRAYSRVTYLCLTSLKYLFSKQAHTS